MLTERAITNANVSTEISACEPISSLAPCVSGRVSAGAKLMAFVSDKYK